MLKLDLEYDAQHGLNWFSWIDDVGYDEIGTYAYGSDI